MTELDPSFMTRNHATFLQMTETIQDNNKNMIFLAYNEVQMYKECAAPLIQISMFCVLSQNCQPFFEK